MSLTSVQVTPLLAALPKVEDTPRVELRCADVSHSIQVRSGCCKRHERQILSGISHTFLPGTLTALMGPSGAGKTTLLSLLRSGRPTRGSITLNGQRHGASTRGLIRTIPQDDVLLAGLTAWEALMYAAELSLPAADCRRRVEQVLSELSLGPELAQTKIGSVHSRGLSGGQRKRVSIGIELLADPAVLLVDEPTSGLDAKMAQDVMGMLKSLALCGRTIISTVHQPSYRIFCLFDELVVLSDGRLAYSGAAAAASQYFASCGFATPVHENPAEYLIGVLNDPAEGGASLTDVWATRAGTVATPTTTVATHAHAHAHTPGVAAAGGDAVAAAPSARPRFVPSAWRQVAVLFRREIFDQVKDRRKLAQTLGMRVTVGLIVGILFNGQGSRDEYSAIFPVTSAMFIAVFNSNLDTTMETLLKAPTARALLRREWLNGLYACESYFVALMGANLLLAGVNTLALVLPLYLLVGFSAAIDKAAVFFGALSLMTVIGMCMGTAIGCASQDMDEARKLLMPMIAPQMIFSGYVLPYKDLPYYFKPLYYASFWQYALAILQINEFADREYTDGCPVVVVEQTAYEDVRKWLKLHANISTPDRVGNITGNCTGSTYLEAEGLWPAKFGGLGGYFLILSGYALIFMTLAYVALKVSLRSAARS